MATKKAKKVCAKKNGPTDILPWSGLSDLIAKASAFLSQLENGGLDLTTQINLPNEIVMHNHINMAPVVRNPPKPPKAESPHKHPEVRIELFKDVSKHWRMRIVAANNEIIMSSEAYSNYTQCRDSAILLCQSMGFDVILPKEEQDHTS